MLPSRAFVNDRRIAHAFFQPLSPCTSDLLDIAAAVYEYDRLVRRPNDRRALASSNARTLQLFIAVRDPEFWREESVVGRLTQLLDWLTADRWELLFEEYKGDRRLAETETQLLAGEVTECTDVVLFSGGLDALIGAALLAEKGPSLAAIAVATNRRQARTQIRLIRSLRKRVKSLVGVNVSAGLRAVPAGTNTPEGERTQRSRAFLFLVIALAAAEAARAKVVHMCENGIGAMNLPYAANQLGIDTSRAAHPRTLHEFEELARCVLGREIAVRNLLFEFTKAEACRALPTGWRELIPETVSCDIGFTDRRGGNLSCGQCASCILRRVSLRAAGDTALDTADRYRFDVVDGRSSPHAVRRAMEAQAERLGSAARAGWSQVVEAAPEVQTVVAALIGTGRSESDAQAIVSRLLVTHADEWRSLAEVPLSVPLRLDRRVLTSNAV
jgi:7-cyano-7-deazaguanine synthase in queuosine biosynthesis